MTTKPLGRRMWGVMIDPQETTTHTVYTCFTDSELEDFAWEIWDEATSNIKGDWCSTKGFNEAWPELKRRIGG